MKYAIIKDGTVINVILWDGQTDVGITDQLVELGDNRAGVGWTYDGTTFTAPPEEEIE